MPIFIKLLISIIAFEHIFILWVEMFAWTTTGPKLFRHLDADFMEKTKSMAANQGLYNGFLSVGLIWSILIGDVTWSHAIATFFLGCVAIAGIYGALTVTKSVFFKQALPAMIALLVIVFT